MKIKTYNQKGEKTGITELSDAVFGLSWNADLVHQVVCAMRSNARMGAAHTKDRSEVAGGGRKPWKQKGTGRARHGSIRSPIWRGGGVTFGPRNEKDYSKKVNKKMKVKAFYTLLSEKLRREEILFIDSIELAGPKTKEAKELLSTLGTITGFEGVATRKNNSTHIVTLEKNELLKRAFGNFSNISISSVAELSIPAIVKYKYLIIANPKESIELIEGKMDRIKQSKIKLKSTDMVGV